MATVYLSSVDGNDGTTPSVSWWNGNQATYATLAAAITAAGNGGLVYVAHNHAETSASVYTLAGPAAAANIVSVVCVTRTTGATADTATVTCTSTTASAVLFTFNGCGYCEGVSFIGGGSTASQSISFFSSALGYWRFKGTGTAKFKLVGTGGAGTITCGTTGAGERDQLLEFNGMNVEFSATGQKILVRCPFLWEGGTLLGSAITNLFGDASTATGCWATVRGVDLSIMGASKALVVASAANWTNYLIERCRTGATPSATTGTVNSHGANIVRMVNCASGATNYTSTDVTYQGTVTSEATIVRSGGASDGTTPISYKAVTTSAAKFVSPLVLPLIPVWNESTSSLTVTVEIVNDGTTLKDDEIWLECNYLGSSSYPLASVASDAKATFQTTAADQTSSSVTWTTTGLGSPVKQKLSATFTPGMKGLIQCRVCVAKASQTVYVCPEVTVA